MNGLESYPIRASRGVALDTSIVNRDLAMAVGLFSIAFTRLDGALASAVRVLRARAYPDCNDTLPIGGDLGFDARLAQLDALADLADLEPARSNELKSCVTQIERLRAFGSVLAHAASDEGDHATEWTARAIDQIASCRECQHLLASSTLAGEVR